MLRRNLKKYIIAMISIFILIFIVLQSFSVACLKLNKHLDCGGIKMGMSQEEFEDLEFEGNPFIIKESIVFDNEKLDAYLTGNKVNYIKIKSSEYSVYGIRIGESKKNAIQLLEEHGFSFNKKNGSYKNGRIEIIFYVDIQPEDIIISQIAIKVNKFELSFVQY